MSWSYAVGEDNINPSDRMWDRASAGCLQIITGVALTTAYAASLRISEVAALKVAICPLIRCAVDQTAGRPTYRRGAGSRPPCVHERATLFEGVAAPVGLLGLVADQMRERSLRHFSREMRFVAGPVAERAAKAVDSRALNAEPRQNLRHGNVRKRTRTSWAGEYKHARAHRRKPFGSRQRSLRQGHAMFAGGLRPAGRHSPDFGRHVHFRPARAQNLTRPRRGENAKLERLSSDRAVGLQLRHQHWHICVGHRGMMAALELRALGEQAREVTTPRRRVSPERWPCALPASRTASIRPRSREAVSGFAIHNGFKTASMAFVPISSTGRGREFGGSLYEAPAPLLAVFLVTPLMRLRFKQGVSDLAECRLVSGRASCFPPNLNWITPGLKDAASLISGEAGFRQPHPHVKRTQPHFRAASAPGEPIYPRSGE